MTTIALLASTHAPALSRFFDALPEEDVTWIKEDVRDPQTVVAAVQGGDGTTRWVAVADGGVVGYAALLPCFGLSAHVGELRLVVARSHRRRGIGREMAQAALLRAFRDDLHKVFVEVPAEQESTAEVFRRLGFEGEALLRDHIRYRNGEIRDLLVLAHFADEVSSVLSSLGIDDEVEGRS